MKRFLLIGALFCHAILVYSQDRIKGQILSAQSKQPVAGATIKVVNSKLVAITDLNGHFGLMLSNIRAILQISSIGYKIKELEVTLPLKDTLSIYLDISGNIMNEVMVSTGYQNLPKERATGSFTKIDKQLFNQQVGTNVLDRIDAIANAVSVDRRTSTPGMSVRGLSTIQGIATPLIVLDNFPYEGSLDNINPNDVESITILKDAAAASIWGTKAGNGVIVITTKKAKYNQQLFVEFNSSVTLTGKPNLYATKRMSSASYIDVEKMLYTNGYYSGLIGSANKPALSPVVELLIKRSTASASEAAAIDNQIDLLKNTDVRNDFNKYVYQQSANQQYALNLKGGTDKMLWTASAGYDNNIGNLADGYNRLNLRYSNTYKLIKNLELSSEIYYTRSLATSGRLPYGNAAYGNYPYTRLADDNGNSLPITRDYRLSYISTAGNGKLLDWKYYPLTDYINDQTNTNIQDILLNTGLRYHIIDGLDADFKYQYERQQTDGKSIHGADSYFTRNLVNTFTQISSTGDVITKIPPGAIYDLSNTNLNSHNIRGQLSLNKNWNKHNFSAIAGSEIRDAKTSAYSFRNYGVNENTLIGGNVDYTNPYPTFITGSTAYIPNANGISENTNKYVSLFANAAYTYDNKYIFSVSGRRDASNLFGVSTNNKWTPLWSAGLGWNVSNESFYKLTWLPYLKLRATYGFSGNIDQSQSAVTIISFLSNSVYTQTPFANITRYANPELRWEKVGMINIGLDFGTKNNRLNGSVEFYQKKGTDLLGPDVLDYTTGIIQVTKNVAGMQGDGWDVQLNSLNIDGRFKWTSSLNLSTYHDKITAYYLSSMQGSNFVGSSAGIGISGLVGKPVHAIFSYKWAGLDPANGDPRGYLNGVVSKDYATITGSGTQVTDLVYHGSALPTWYGNLGNSFRYKNINLDVRLTYKFGYYFRKSSINYTDLFYSGIGNSDYEQRWQKPGDELTTNVPSMVYPATSSRDAFYNGSAVNVLKGDNIRLQYVSMGYELNNRFLKRLHLNGLNIYGSVNNVGILWRANKEGIDPDYPIGSIPPTQIYSIGIKGNF